MGRERSLIGRRIGGDRFELVELLGSGAFAEVYRSKQLALNRDVAIKILNEWDAQDQQLVKRFHHEAEAIARFDHPNIVRIFDHGEEDGLHYYVMNLLPHSLRSLLANRQPLPVPFVLRMAHQIASALDYAQRTVENFVHRDIKPENVMLDREDNAVLSDFGLVRGEEFSRMTLDGTVMGTPAYMSPEQWRGEHADGRADLYAFGIMLYECATGAPPFRGEPLSVCHQHVNVAPVQPRKHRPELPPALEKVILRLIEKKAEKRYPTAGAFLADLPPLDKASQMRMPVSPIVSPATPTVGVAPSNLQQEMPAETVAIVPEEDKIRQARRRTTGRRVAFAATAVISIGAAIVLWQLLSKTKQTVQTLSAVRVSGLLDGAGTPIAGAIFLDDKPTGATTPALLTDINPTTHMIDVRAEGYRSIIQTVRVAPGETSEVVITLRPASLLEFSALQISSHLEGSGNPVFGEIFLDGKPTGLTAPALLTDIDPVSHSVEIRSSDHGTAKQTVKAAPGETLKVNIVFKSQLPTQPITPSQTQGAPLRITSIPPSEIWVDGQSHGTPAGGKLEINVAPGQHELEFRHPTYGSARKTVEVNKNLGLDDVFKWLGTVTVTAMDENNDPVPAIIFLNDKPTENRTPGNIALPVGRHSIRVNKFGYEMRDPPQTVQIKGGDQMTLSFVLRRIN